MKRVLWRPAEHREEVEVGGQCDPRRDEHEVVSSPLPPTSVVAAAEDQERYQPHIHREGWIQPQPNPRQVHADSRHGQGTHHGADDESVHGRDVAVDDRALPHQRRRCRPGRSVGVEGASKGRHHVCCSCFGARPDRRWDQGGLVASAATEFQGADGGRVPCPLSNRMTKGLPRCPGCDRTPPGGGVRQEDIQGWLDFHDRVIEGSHPNSGCGRRETRRASTICRGIGSRARTLGPEWTGFPRGSD